MQEAQDSFASVQRAASRQGKPREFHAGHFYPAAKGGATSGRQAGIELGSLNISKGAKFEGTINLYAAEKLVYLLHGLKIWTCGLKLKKVNQSVSIKLILQMLNVI